MHACLTCLPCLDCESSWSGQSLMGNLLVGYNNEAPEHSQPGHASGAEADESGRTAHIAMGCEVMPTEP